MSFEVKGKIIVRMPEQQVSDKFKKREFVLEIPSGASGAYTEQIKFQLTQDRCGLLDKFNEGDNINVHFNLRGRGFVKNDETIYFTNLEAWRLEKASSSNTTYDEAPIPDESNMPF